MAKELTINGKNYLPSTVLSGRFSYTADYLSKLAREGKIDATRVGRQWFVNEKSLELFLSKTEEEKIKRSKELRVQRKLERKSHEYKNRKTKTKKSNNKKHITEALVQSVAVVACGVIVGSLGFVAYQDGVRVNSILSAAKDTAELVVESVVPENVQVQIPTNNQLAFLNFSFFLGWFFDNNSEQVETTIVQKSEAVQVAKQIDIDIPTKKEKNNALILLDPDTSTTTVQDIQDSFSDEVKVTFDEPDTGIVEPVFRKRTDESYRFLLVPVTAETESQKLKDKGQNI